MIMKNNNNKVYVEHFGKNRKTSVHEKEFAQV